MTPTELWAMMHEAYNKAVISVHGSKENYEKFLCDTDKFLKQLETGSE